MRKGIVLLVLFVLALMPFNVVAQSGADLNLPVSSIDIGMYPGYGRDIVFHPNGSGFFFNERYSTNTNSNDLQKYYNLVTGEITEMAWTNSSFIGKFAMNDDYFARAGNRELAVYDFETFTLQAQVEICQRVVSMDVEGNILMVHCNDADAYLLNLETGEVRIIEMAFYITRDEFNLVGEWLIIGSDVYDYQSAFEIDGPTVALEDLLVRDGESEHYRCPMEKFHLAELNGEPIGWCLSGGEILYWNLHSGITVEPVGMEGEFTNGQSVLALDIFETELSMTSIATGNDLFTIDFDEESSIYQIWWNNPQFASMFATVSTEGIHVRMVADGSVLTVIPDNEVLYFDGVTMYTTDGYGSSIRVWNVLDFAESSSVAVIDDSFTDGPIIFNESVSGEFVLLGREMIYVYAQGELVSEFITPRTIAQNINFVDDKIYVLDGIFENLRVYTTDGELLATRSVQNVQQTAQTGFVGWNNSVLVGGYVISPAINSVETIVWNEEETQVLPVFVTNSPTVNLAEISGQQEIVIVHYDADGQRYLQKFVAGELMQSAMIPDWETSNTYRFHHLVIGVDEVYLITSSNHQYQRMTYSAELSLVNVTPLEGISGGHSLDIISGELVTLDGEGLTWADGYQFDFGVIISSGNWGYSNAFSFVTYFGNHKRLVTTIHF